MLSNEKLNCKGKKWTTPSGTVYRVFEMYEESEKNESGLKPIFITPDVEDKKKKRGA